MLFPKYLLNSTSDGLFYFSLTAAREVILTSQVYFSKTGALIGIELVRVNCPKEERYDRGRTTNDQYYFYLKTNEGHVIAMSEMYSSPGTRDYGIRFVQQNGPTLEIEDQTCTEPIALSSTPSAS